MDRKNIPNQLTMLRLVFAVAFFVVLEFYQYGPSAPTWPLWVGLAVFVVGMLTDAADGYLARRWHVISAFGRIMDPFADKVITLGALIYLAGPRFYQGDMAEAAWSLNAVSGGTQVSGVYPWMVILVISRELLVTGIRGEMEARGIKFGANVWGKVKTILQSVIVPVLLIIVALDPNAQGWRWLVWVRDPLVWVTVLFSAVTGLPYVLQSIRAVRGAE